MHDMVPGALSSVRVIVPQIRFCNYFPPSRLISRFGLHFANNYLPSTNLFGRKAVRKDF